MSFKKLDLGTKLETNAIERLLGTKKERNFVLVDENPYGLSLCYIEDHGTVYANEVTKEKNLKENDRYLFLIGELLTDLRGKVVSLEMTPKYLLLTRGQYEQIIDLKNTYGDLTKAILKVTCADEAYQKNTYSYVGVYGQAKESEKVREHLEKSLEQIQAGVAKSPSLEETRSWLFTAADVSVSTDNFFSEAALAEGGDLSDSRFAEESEDSTQSDESEDSTQSDESTDTSSESKADPFGDA